MEKATILVTGSTGGTGSETVSQLLKKGIAFDIGCSHARLKYRSCARSGTIALVAERHDNVAVFSISHHLVAVDTPIPPVRPGVDAKQCIEPIFQILSNG